MWLNNSISLKFILTMSRKNKDGSRAFFYYETQSNSKYIGTKDSRAIKRYMGNFYFVLYDKDDFANGFILRANDVYCLLNIIDNQFLPYYFGNNRIYSIIDDKLVIVGNYSECVYTQSSTRVLRLLPVICSYEDDKHFQEGVQISIGTNSFVIPIDRFLGFIHILKSTDMYTVASTLALYAKTGPYGVNVYTKSGLGGGIEPDFLPSSKEEDNSNNGKNNFLNRI